MFVCVSLVRYFREYRSRNTTNDYTFQLEVALKTEMFLQSEWDELPENKLPYTFFPVLKQCVVCPRTNKKEETVIYIVHFLFIAHSFLLKSEEPPVCIGCDELLTVEHILLTCSDLIEIRESHFIAQSLRVLFQISPEKIFNFLKEISVFGNI